MSKYGTDPVTGRALTKNGTPRKSSKDLTPEQNRAAKVAKMQDIARSQGKDIAKGIIDSQALPAILDAVRIGKILRKFRDADYVQARRERFERMVSVANATVNHASTGVLDLWNTLLGTIGVQSLADPAYDATETVQAFLNTIPEEIENPFGADSDDEVSAE